MLQAPGPSFLPLTKPRGAVPSARVASDWDRMSHQWRPYTPLTWGSRRQCSSLFCVPLLLHRTLLGCSVLAVTTRGCLVFT